MSEPVSKAEVEDVLSSIRKLVSDDAASDEHRPAVPVSPILVTPEVSEITEENIPDPDVSSSGKDRDVASGTAWNSSFILTDTGEGEASVSGASQPGVVISGPVESAEVEIQAEPAVSETSEAETSEIAEISPTGETEEVADEVGTVLDFSALAEAPLAEFADAEGPEDVEAFQRLEDRAAHMEAAVSDQNEDWETDGTELSDLAVADLPGFVDAGEEVMATGDIYVLGQDQAVPVAEAPFVLSNPADDITETTDDASPEPFLLTEASLVGRKDIVLGAGSITPEEITTHERFTPEELLTEEQVAADIEAFVEREPDSEEPTVMDEEAAEAVAEEIPADVAVDEMAEPELPSAEFVESELAEALTELPETKEDTAGESLMAEPEISESPDELAETFADASPLETGQVDNTEEAETEAGEVVSEGIQDAEETENEVGQSEVVAKDPVVPEDVAALVMDEDHLRGLVADVVRQELRGALGERITRNMRKMVRREIYRTASSRDFEG